MRKKTLTTSLLVALLAACQPPKPIDTSPGDDTDTPINNTDNPVINSNYSFEKVLAGENEEFRLKYDDAQSQQHFMSVINAQGAVAIRPHPGKDVNGWGGTWYPQPGTTAGILANAKINSDSFKIKENGIHLDLEGVVSRSATDSFGNWKFGMDFEFSPSTKTVKGTGDYTITLPQAPTEDINLYKIANNLMENVPLLNGGNGTTGDMGASVSVTGDQAQAGLNWEPLKNDSYFPTNSFMALNVKTKAEQNIVDTKAQGYDRIEPAYKPSISVEFSGDTPLTFGGSYDRKFDKLYSSDNVGINAQVRKGSTANTELTFKVNFTSDTLPGDGTDPNIIANRPPEAKSINVEANMQGFTYFDVPATDPDGDNVLIRIKELPKNSEVFYIVGSSGVKINSTDDKFNSKKLYIYTSDELLGKDRLVYEVSDGINVAEGKVNLIHMDKTHGGQGDSVLSEEFTNQPDKFTADIVAHGLNDLEKLVISDDGKHIVFVNPSEPLSYFNGSSRYIDELLRSDDKELDLCGVKHLTDGAGDPWGLIHNTNIGFISNKHIIIGKSTYISHDLDVFDLEKKKETSLYKGRTDDQTVSWFNNARFDPLTNVGFMSTPYPTSWISINPETSEIISRSPFGDTPKFYEIIATKDGKRYGAQNMSETYPTSYSLIEIQEDGTTKELISQDTVRKNVLQPEIGTQALNYSVGAPLMKRDDTGEILFPMFGSISNGSTSIPSAYIVKYNPVTQQTSLAAKNLTRVNFGDRGMDVHDNELFAVYDKTNIVRLKLK